MCAPMHGSHKRNNNLFFSPSLPPSLHPVGVCVWSSFLPACLPACLPPACLLPASCLHKTTRTASYVIPCCFAKAIEAFC
jgi:hypothetical protein